MRKISQTRRTKTAGTPEHEKCKEKTRKTVKSYVLKLLVHRDMKKCTEGMRKRSQELRTKIPGTPEHEKCKEEMINKESKATC